MKKLAFIILVLLAKPCFSIGWHTVTKENIAESNISISFREDDFLGCHRVEISFPDIFNFKDLGERKFSSATLKKVINKDRGWQLTGKGTTIGLPTRKKNSNIEVSSLCLSKNDIEQSSLSVWYDTPPGSPPVVIIINLVEFL